MAQATPVDLGRTPPYTPPATITKVDLGSKAPVSQHRALAAAISGFKGNPDSSNPHEAAVGKIQPVVIQQPKPAKTSPATIQPIHLGTGGQ